MTTLSITNGVRVCNQFENSFHNKATLHNQSGTIEIRMNNDVNVNPNHSRGFIDHHQCGQFDHPTFIVRQYNQITILPQYWEVTSL